MSSDLKTIFNAPETFVIQAPPQCRKCRTYRKYRHPKFKVLIPYIGVYAPPPPPMKSNTTILAIFWKIKQSPNTEYRLTCHP